MNSIKRLLQAAIIVAMGAVVTPATAQENRYTPTPENLQARREFADSKFGIFIHWGIYSMFAQGEWYLQNAEID